MVVASEHRGQENGVGYFSSSSLGLPRFRIVDSKPNVAAIFACQSSLPKGCCRFTQVRIVTSHDQTAVDRSKSKTVAPAPSIQDMAGVPSNLSAQNLKYGLIMEANYIVRRGPGNLPYILYLFLEFST